MRGANTGTGFTRFESQCVDCEEVIVEYRTASAPHRAPRTRCADCLAQIFDARVVSGGMQKPEPPKVLH